jgi:RHS repeat-associated protein
MSTSGTVTARYDYLPFGEEIPSSLGGRSAIVGYNPTATINEKFTQKERDSESGLDYFGARYYSSAQGRFTSVDPADGEKSVPQSWNRYAYVLNNPLKYTDPDGEKWAVQYTGTQATFRWYDGDTIPSDWPGKWEEYTAGWYIGADAAIRLGSRGANDVLILTKDLFSDEDWGKLQSADPANLSHEQREILFSGAAQIADQVETIRRMKFVAELGAYAITAFVNPVAVNSGAKTVADILRGAAAGKASSSRQFSKPGGMAEANADFDALRPINVQSRGGGMRTGQLSDGSKVTVRPQSSGGNPTLEIRPPTGRPIKIRY